MLIFGMKCQVQSFAMQLIGSKVFFINLPEVIKDEKVITWFR